jgi:hypothetical protein
MLVLPLLRLTQHWAVLLSLKQQLLLLVMLLVMPVELLLLLYLLSSPRNMSGAWVQCGIWCCS